MPKHSGIAACIMEGMADKEISRAMGLGSHVVKWEVQKVLKMIGARNRTHSGQTLRVREMTTEEAHHIGFAPA